MASRLIAVGGLLLPALAWGGGAAVRHVTSAPAMDEPGLIILGLGLVGAGFAMLRRR